MKHISYEDAVLILKQAVEERGSDWIYPDPNICPTCKWDDEECEWHASAGCRYFRTSGGPACLVGEFIYRALEPSDYTPAHLETEHASSVLGQLGGVLEIDERTTELLVVAQQMQDSGQPWGASLARAIDYVSGM